MNELKFLRKLAMTKFLVKSELFFVHLHHGTGGR